jgi:hypothetical protein
MEPAYLLDYTLNHANSCTHHIFNFGMADQIAFIVEETAQRAIVLHHFVLVQNCASYLCPNFILIPPRRSSHPPMRQESGFS